MADIFSKRVRSKIMSKIRGKHTKPELSVRKELSKRGYRFTVHAKMLGSPDIVFPKRKVAIFVDGDFWHGYDWKVGKKTPPRGFWQKKIKRNMGRDKRITRTLRRKGWKVIRLWEHDVTKDIDKCMRKCIRAVGKPNLKTRK